VHSDGLGEFHIVRHRGGAIMTTGRYVRPRSGTRVGDVARGVENGSEALRMMIDILVNNGEMTRGRRPAWLPGSNGSY
jgi:hypothetical protein